MMIEIEASTDHESRQITPNVAASDLPQVILSRASDVDMTVGGVDTAIERRYIVDPSHAAQAVTSFIKGDPLADPDLTWIVWGSPMDARSDGRLS